MKLGRLRTPMAGNMPPAGQPRLAPGPATLAGLRAPAEVDRELCLTSTTRPWRLDAEQTSFFLL